MLYDHHDQDYIAYATTSSKDPVGEIRYVKKIPCESSKIWNIQRAHENKHWEISCIPVYDSIIHFQMFNFALGMSYNKKKK